MLAQENSPIELKGRIRCVLSDNFLALFNIYFCLPSTFMFVTIGVIDCFTLTEEMGKKPLKFSETQVCTCDRTICSWLMLGFLIGISFMFFPFFLFSRWGNVLGISLKTLPLLSSEKVRIRWKKHQDHLSSFSKTSNFLKNIVVK